jgi:hypothetical protein
MILTLNTDQVQTYCSRLGFVIERQWFTYNIGSADIYIYILMAQQPVVGHTLLIIAASGSHSDTPQESSGRQISPTQRPLPDNTHHTQDSQTSTQPAAFETGNPSKSAAADPRHWNPHFYILLHCHHIQMGYRAHSYIM